MSNNDYFYERLMANPLVAFEWARAIARIDNATADDIEVASRCFRTPASRLSEKERQQLAVARLWGLGSKMHSERLARELPALWIAEEATCQGLGVFGMEAWVDTMRQAPDYMLDRDARLKLSEAAAGSREMASWLDRLPPAKLGSLAESFSGAAASGCGPILVAISSRIEPSQCAAWLAKTLTSNSAHTGKPLKGLGQETARAMASRALENPESASTLLHAILFSSLEGGWSDCKDGDDPLAGVLEAIARKADALISDEFSDMLFKGAKGSKAPLSLAMELMCARRVEAGFAALEWAHALGYRGRSPVAYRTDGRNRTKFKMALPVLADDSFSRSRVQVSKFQEIAALMRDGSMSDRLEKLGWAPLKSNEAKELAKKLAETISRSGSAAKSRPLWLGGGDVKDAKEGLLAFWEARKLGRVASAPSALKNAKPRL